jgi:hypothetical protein
MSPAASPSSPYASLAEVGACKTIADAVGAFDNELQRQNAPGLNRGIGMLTAGRALTAIGQGMMKAPAHGKVVGAIVTVVGAKLMAIGAAQYGIAMTTPIANVGNALDNQRNDTSAINSGKVLESGYDMDAEYSSAINGLLGDYAGEGLNQIAGRSGLKAGPLLQTDAVRVVRTALDMICTPEVKAKPEMGRDADTMQFDYLGRRQESNSSGARIDRPTDSIHEKDHKGDK